MLTTRSSVVSLHRTLTAPREARRHLERVVGGADDVVAVAGLLVTELVTNSVRHARTGDHDHVEVKIDIDDERVRVEVRDEGTSSPGALEPPRRTVPPEPNEGGFGLLFVNSLADRWGSERRQDGMTVWFEVDRRRSP